MYQIETVAEEEVDQKATRVLPRSDEYIGFVSPVQKNFVDLVNKFGSNASKMNNREHKSG